MPSVVLAEPSVKINSKPQGFILSHFLQSNFASHSFPFISYFVPFLLPRWLLGGGGGGGHLDFGVDQYTIEYPRLKGGVKLKDGPGELGMGFLDGNQSNQLNPCFEEEVIRDHSPMQGCVSDRPVRRTRCPEYYSRRVLEGLCLG